MKAVFSLLIVLGVLQIQRGAAVGLRATSLHSAVMAAHAQSVTGNLAEYLEEITVAKEALEGGILSPGEQAGVVIRMKELQEEMEEMKAASTEILVTVSK